MVSFCNVKDYPRGLEVAVAYIHGVWGRPENLTFYRDAIVHSSMPGRPLPRFYLMLEDDRIIGCHALLTNDLISRQDLYPWFGCLWVDPGARGRKLSRLMMAHAAGEALALGFDTLYLTTDHEDFYERFGWERIEDGYDFKGEQTRIYRIATSQGF